MQKGWKKQILLHAKSAKFARKKDNGMVLHNTPINIDKYLLWIQYNILIIESLVWSRTYQVTILQCLSWYRARKLQILFVSTN